MAAIMGRASATGGPRLPTFARARRGPAIAMLVAVIGCDVGGGKLGKLEESASGADARAISLQRPADQEIQQRLAGIYAEVEGLEDVQVRVREGVVHLQGSTDAFELEQRAVAIATGLEDVVHVASEITSTSSGGLLSSIGRSVRGLARGAVDLLPQLTAAVVAFLPFLLLSIALGRWQHPLRALGVRQLTGSIVRFVLRGLLLFGGLLLALDVLGIMGIVGALVGALGLFGLVVGIAFKDWIANYFPGMMLGLHPPFQSGHLVQIGDYEGRVIKITPRATVLMTTDGEELRIPNGMLLKETLINYSCHRQRRLRITIPISPQADLRLAQELGQRALLELDGVMPDPPPFMRTRAITRDEVEVEFFAWIDQDAVNFRTLESRARRAVLEALPQGGVALPEPTYHVRVQAIPTIGHEGSGGDGPPEDPERRDQLFLDEQLEEARHRSTDGERDLLAEGRRPTSARGPAPHHRTDR